MKLFFHAIKESLVGFIFAVFITLLIVVFSDFQPLKVLQRWGSDMGARIFSDPSIAYSTEFLKTDSPFVFIDVDLASCKEYFELQLDAPGCADPAKMPPGMLAEIVEAVTRLDPSVIVLDYQLPVLGSGDFIHDDSGIAKLRSTLVDGTGAPIVAPATLRPDIQAGYVEDVGTKLISDSYAQGRLRMASFVTWTDSDVDDGVIRGYPAVVSVNQRDGTGRVNTVPAAPFLISLIAESEKGLDRADLLFYGRSENADCELLEGSKVLKKLDRHLVESCNAQQVIDPSVYIDDRLVFSIHSLAFPGFGHKSDYDLDWLADRYYGTGTIESGTLYQRYNALDYIIELQNKRFFDFPENGLKDRIVVIGTSSVGALDWHLTPLGFMSGAEVIINASRAYADFPIIESKKDFFDKLIYKLKLVLIAEIALFPLGYWVVAVLHNRRNNVRATGSNGFMTRLGYTSFSFLFYVMGVCLAILAVLLSIYRDLSIAEAPLDIDFLLPVVAVVFEGVVEVCKNILVWLNMMVERVSNTLLKWLRAIL